MKTVFISIQYADWGQKGTASYKELFLAFDIFDRNGDDVIPRFQIE